MDKCIAAKSQLIIFPESFIPGYPRKLSFGTVVGSRSDAGRALWHKYASNSIRVPSEDTEYLGKLAKKAGAYLVMGVTELGNTGTLYCTVLYFNPNGELIGKHRKLKPTAAERIIWGEGDGKDLKTHSTPFGRIGGLICWENYMPLARTHVYEQGIDIYIAPTADQRDSWQATMKHIATEGRCFVIGCNQYMNLQEYPSEILESEHISNTDNVLSRGGSVVVDPLGKVVEGPIWDKPDILSIEIDTKNVLESRMDFDPVGHYARNDVFELKLKTRLSRLLLTSITIHIKRCNLYI